MKLTSLLHYLMMDIAISSAYGASCSDCAWLFADEGYAALWMDSVAQDYHVS